MGKPTGFMEIRRETGDYRPVEERLKDYREIPLPLAEDRLRQQGARCMDCGIPFCMSGCPLGNVIPDWNDLIYRNRWREAIDLLHSTNNFPEFTGRVCPAPCEASCVLNFNDDAVTIKQIEYNIIEHAFAEGWIVPEPGEKRTGKKIAVVGSGPAGLACAQQLARAGHDVTVFERDDRIGGLLMYGIPDFKLEKHILQRRLDQMSAEGVVFRTKAHVGKDIAVADLRKQFDAICLTGGSRKPRDLKVPGRELDGVHFAMEFLEQQNRRGAGESLKGQKEILATGKHVVILGGGDTGSDCLGTSLRQGAASVLQFELLPQPPDSVAKDLTWPNWPMILRSSTSHEEGGIRDWSVNTKSLSGKGGRVAELHGIRVAWGAPDATGRRHMEEVPGSEFEVNADLVLLAMGYVHPEHEGMLTQAGVEFDARGNVKTGADFMTGAPGIFAAGDMRRGQSLVVWAIWEGRESAHYIDKYLMGSSNLPLRDRTAYHQPTAPAAGA